MILYGKKTNLGVQWLHDYVTFVQGSHHFNNSVLKPLVPWAILATPKSFLTISVMKSISNITPRNPIMRKTKDITLSFCRRLLVQQGLPLGWLCVVCRLSFVICRLSRPLIGQKRHWGGFVRRRQHIVELIHLNNNICCSRKTRIIMKV